MARIDLVPEDEPDAGVRCHIGQTSDGVLRSLGGDISRNWPNAGSRSICRCVAGLAIGKGELSYADFSDIRECFAERQLAE